MIMKYRVQEKGAPNTGSPGLLVFMTVIMSEQHWKLRIRDATQQANHLKVENTTGNTQLQGNMKIGKNHREHHRWMQVRGSVIINKTLDFATHRRDTLS